MENLQKIIQFFYIWRRSEENNLTNEGLSILRLVDENYLSNQLSDNIVMTIDSKKLENNFIYERLDKFTGQSIIYCKNDNGQLFYYIKIDHLKFLRLPSQQVSNAIVFTEEEVAELKILELDIFNCYFSYQYQAIYEVMLKEVLVTSEQLVYNPQENPLLKDFESGTASYEFENAKGRKRLGDGVWDILKSALISTQVTDSIKREVEYSLHPTTGLIWLLPHITSKNTLYYTYYTKGDQFGHVSKYNNIAIHLRFKHFSALMMYLNQTIFYHIDHIDYLERNKTWIFFTDSYLDYVKGLMRSKNYKHKMEVMYYVPEYLLSRLDSVELWDMVIEAINNPLTDSIGLQQETIILKLLQGLKTLYKQPQNFLLELIYKKAAKENKSVLQKLIYRMDGDNFVALIKFLWGVWKESKFIYPDSEINPEYKKIEAPIILPYRAKKEIGFYFTSLKVEDKSKTELFITFGTGKYFKKEVGSIKDGKYIEYEEIKETAIYHPFYPIYLVKTDGEQDFGLEDLKNETLVPAFVLYANELKAFWSNVATTGEYAIDILTTLSGIGNIYKFRHLAKIATKAEKLLFISKTGQAVATARAAVAGTAAVVEISSGTINALLKLTGFNDTEQGQALSEFLFYLELLSLSGELTVAIHNGLRKNAKKLVEKPEDVAKLEKKLDEFVIEDGNSTRKLSEADKGKFFDELRKVAEDNIKGKGLYGGKVLSKADIDKWTMELLKKYGTKLEKVDNFDNPKILAQFDPNTNTIKYKDDVTEYFMAHESFHAEEFKKIGFDEYVKDAPLRGVKEVEYTTENWIRLYKREKYVYDRLVVNEKKYVLNNEELNHAFYYFDGKVVLELEKRNIKIPKL
ncbi:zincin-like metallopeptidase toxin domain-containing protein [Flavobacterium filum]|uniref:zincin-like metallopeptidase toxin domain-containing protein n=1 Tax=Flavobacterium filum TaxID=370974 RepID=UPI0023F55056|nr:zincin-like metallopeptidase toxin domain-containing protein [Flavobacterium filum]